MSTLPQPNAIQTEYDHSSIGIDKSDLQNIPHETEIESESACYSVWEFYNNYGDSVEDVHNRVPSLLIPFYYIQ